MHHIGRDTPLFQTRVQTMAHKFTHTHDYTPYMYHTVSTHGTLHSHHSRRTEGRYHLALVVLEEGQTPSLCSSQGLELVVPQQFQDNSELLLLQYQVKIHINTDHMYNEVKLKLYTYSTRTCIIIADIP